MTFKDVPGDLSPHRRSPYIAFYERNAYLNGEAAAFLDPSKPVMYQLSLDGNAIRIIPVNADTQGSYRLSRFEGKSGVTVGVPTELRDSLAGNRYPVRKVVPMGVEFDATLAESGGQDDDADLE